MYNRLFDKDILIYESLFSEAVIYPETYLKNIQKKINSLELYKYNNLTLRKVCNLLNLKFYFNNIKFMPDLHVMNGMEKYIDYGINRGATLPDKNATIGIFLNKNILNIKNKDFYNSFLEWILFILKHELVHRGQNLAIKDKQLRSEVMIKNYKDKIDYLSDPQEIMARAWEIVELFKLLDYTNEEILILIKTDNKEKYRNDTLKVYKDLFKKDNMVLKRLYKYMYEYLQSGV